MTEVANIPARWDGFFFLDIPQVKLLFTILGYPKNAMWDIHIAMWDETSKMGCLKNAFSICRGDQSSHVQRRLSKVPLALLSRPCGDPRISADRNHRSDPREMAGDCTRKL